MPIWYEWRDRQIHVSTQSQQRKVKNIQRDPRVTVLIDTNDFPYRGVMIHGTAHITPTRMISFDYAKGSLQPLD